MYSAPLITSHYASKHGWVRDNWDCLSSCLSWSWKQLKLHHGVGNHPAATSSEKWSNLKALRTKCDIHDLDCSSRAEPRCHHPAGVTPVQTEEADERAGEEKQLVRVGREQEREIGRLTFITYSSMYLWVLQLLSFRKTNIQIGSIFLSGSRDWTLKSIQLNAKSL